MKLKYKVFLFLQFGAFGAWVPYLPLFLYERSFSGVQIGLLLGTMPIVMMIFQPMWSYLSDLLNKRRVLLIFSCLGMGITMLGIGLAEQFIFAFMWSILFAVLWAPLSPISTAMLLDSLEETGEPEKYGLIRLWGSIGFSITSLLVGSLFLGQILNYLTWLAGGLYVLLGLAGSLLPEKKGMIAQPKIKRSQILSGNSRLVLYLLASMFIGATFGVYNNYITLFMHDLNAQDWLVGLTVSLQALIEVPLMLLVPFSLKHFRAQSIILAGAVLLPLRWAVYFFLQRPGWVAPLQIIHGIAIVSFFVVGVAYIDQLISPGWRATGQGLYGTTMFGVGSALGVYLAGFAIEWFEVRSVWGLNFILGLIGLGMLLFAFNREKRGNALQSTIEGASGG